MVWQGLSEPVGALIALLFVKPFLTPNLLQYMLAFVGGIMVSKIALNCLVLLWYSSSQIPLSTLDKHQTTACRVVTIGVCTADLCLWLGAVAGGKKM